ncbi:ankyrin repeat domain-containing protein [Acinetobacter lactucae]|uniref:ankyrin repeat domain-containing protein n=1 Tax=Acinetobacter lactucae TaxID=1785128 RepID=UPI00358DBF6C
MKVFRKYLILLLFTTPIYAAPMQETQRRESQEQELIDLFFAASRTGNQEVIHEFLKNGFPVDARNDNHYTALMVAAYHGQKEIVTTLLQYGADRCLRDSKGHTAVMGAIVKAEWSIAKQLKSTDCDAKAKKDGQLTTEAFAKVFGQEQKLEKLLSQPE